MSLPEKRPLRVFIIAGEESGDALGGPLMRALGERLGGGVTFRGIGGTRMQAAGLASLFPMDDLTAMGFGEVIGKLPTIARRLKETVAAVLADPPDLLMLVDAPDFTHRVAARVRRKLPDLPIVKYVAPTVWVWRSGRARAMRGTIDHVLALLPFEPEVMQRLGGPPTTYVGHPLLGAPDHPGGRATPLYLSLEPTAPKRTDPGTTGGLHVQPDPYAHRRVLPGIPCRRILDPSAGCALITDNT